MGYEAVDWIDIVSKAGTFRATSARSQRRVRVCTRNPGTSRILLQFLRGLLPPRPTQSLLREQIIRLNPDAIGSSRDSIVLGVRQNPKE